MKSVLLDQGLAPYAATILRQHGVDAVHVSEIGMEQAEDIQIKDHGTGIVDVSRPARTCHLATRTERKLYEER
jgi:hypothetical protein